jgi:hypothetical protein
MIFTRQTKTSHSNPFRHTIAFYITFAPTTMAMAFTNIKQVNLVHFHTTNVTDFELAISEIKNVFNVNFNTI